MTVRPALYVHVPVCASKCAYCDFISRSGDLSYRTAVAKALKVQLKHLIAHSTDEGFSTVYVGGGTPTALGEHLDGLLETIELVLGTTRPPSEFTLETNPEDTTEEMIEQARARGVDRVSMGVQSFDDTVLAVLGRNHTAQRARDALLLLQAKVPNFSLDLMGGVPTQTHASWRSSLNEAATSGASHISVYPLQVEPHTLMDKRISRGELQGPSEDAAADMMEDAEKVLGEAGLRRYEIASYAMPGAASRHNTAYWTGISYLGIGPSAASMFSVEEFMRLRPALDLHIEPPPSAVRVRFSWPASIDSFIVEPMPAPENIEFLDLHETIREDLMLAFRRSEGVSLAHLEECAREIPALSDVFEKLLAQGLLEEGESEGEDSDRRRLVPTRRGWLLGNELFGAIWNAEDTKIDSM